MLILAALAAVQAAPPAAPAPAAAPKPLVPLADRYHGCVSLATGNDPHAGEVDAAAWQLSGGKFFARQCLGIALANQGKWQAAAQAFEGAADEAEVAHDDRASRYWSQAGNAWLAAGNPAKARTALDAALAAGTLEGTERGEAAFDRARALVLLGDLPAARIDMDLAIKLEPKDPLIWLSSATLARRMKDIPRAKQDIIEAYKLSSDDAAVNFEIGNIAIASGDANGARMAWSDAQRLGKDGPVGKAAGEALSQLSTPADKKP
ncbi:MAG: tetratricopeptide repeat protein [Sphingomonas sp.]